MLISFKSPLTSKQISKHNDVFCQLVFLLHLSSSQRHCSLYFLQFESCGYIRALSIREVRAKWIQGNLWRKMAFTIHYLCMFSHLNQAGVHGYRSNRAHQLHGHSDRNNHHYSFHSYWQFPIQSLSKTSKRELLA